MVINVDNGICMSARSGLCVNRSTIFEVHGWGKPGTVGRTEIDKHRDYFVIKERHGMVRVFGRDILLSAQFNYSYEITGAVAGVLKGGSTLCLEVGGGGVHVNQSGIQISY